MTKSPRVLAFAGSARSASFNQQLVRIGAAGVEAGGAECTLIDLRDYPLPLYDGDLEADSAADPLIPRFAVRIGGELLDGADDRRIDEDALAGQLVDFADRPHAQLGVSDRPVLGERCVRLRGPLGR